MRILVVEDDYVSRVKLNALFSPYGYCDNAPNGEIALKMFESAQSESVPYNLVTMDIEMPRMDGIEVVKRMREMEKSWAAALGEAAKILMVTVKHSLKDVSSAYYDGCDGYLPKPTTPESVQKALADFGINL